MNSAGALTTGTVNASSSPITFSAINSLKVSIDSNGYLLINTATSGGSYFLQVQGSTYIANTLTVAGVTNLGAVGNVIITGGTSGQYLSTNGAGGLSWATVTGGGGGASVTISDSAPISSSAGNLWWDSSVGNLAIYYVDAAGGQWVDAVSSYVFPSTVNNLNISTATQSVSTTTGALVVTGGVGIGGNLYVGGGAASTSTTTGALVVTGGVGIGGNLNVAGTITSNQLTVQYTTITNVTIITTDVFTLTNTTTVVSTTTGALVVAGGVGIGGGLFVGGAITATSLTLLSGETEQGNVSILSTTSSNSTTTGALTVTGGVGIGGNLNLGGSLNIGTTLLVNGVTLNPVTISDSAPATPAAGQLWWDSNIGNLAIYYVDTLGGQWVDAVSSYVFPSSVNNLSVTTSTQSASTTTGALVVAGGVGVGGALYINTTSFIANSQIITTATIGSYAASNTGTTGTFLISNLTTATYNIANTSTGVTTGTGALTVQGGVFISNTASAAIQLSATTASNTVTAALIVAGGAYIGGSIVYNGLIATNATATTIASAATIAPVTQILYVSGTTQITTITAPKPISVTGGQITLIPTGLWTTAATGNIALASTAVVSKALIMTYDAGTAKWYPSY